MEFKEQNKEKKKQTKKNRLLNTENKMLVAGWELGGGMDEIHKGN